MELNGVDSLAIRLMRSVGVLEDLNPHRLDQKDGVIMVACADGDQMPDLFAHQARLVSAHRDAPRVHTLALNGGALLIPTRSPLRNKALREGDVLCQHITAARKLKGISTIVLYGHTPCGAAGLHDLGIHDCISLLVEAKAQIRKTYPRVPIACFFHVADGAKKRTYFISPKRWRNYQEETER
jgi:hypothetical protein